MTSRDQVKLRVATIALSLSAFLTACGSESSTDAQSGDGGSGPLQSSSSGAGTGTQSNTSSPGGMIPPPSNPTDPALYPGGQRHSPASAPVVAHWKEILANNPARNPKNFIRLGDNLSHMTDLLGCM